MAEKNDPMFASLLNLPATREALPVVRDLCKLWRKDGENQKTCHIVEVALGGDMDQYLFVAAYFAPNDERTGGYSTLAYMVDNLHAELASDNFGNGPEGKKDACAALYDFLHDFERVDAEIAEDQEFMSEEW